MVITKITPISNSRSRIYIDEEFAFVLYKGELRKYEISEGKEISQETYNTISREILPLRAKKRSMELLKTKAYTQKQLSDKMIQGGYLPEIIEDTINYLKGYGYINDHQYAMDYIHYKSTQRSRKRIEQDLTSKGIDKKMIDEAFSLWEDSGECMDEMSQIKKLLDKKHYSEKETDKKEQQKIAMFLFRKGFSMESIRQAMKVHEEY